MALGPYCTALGIDEEVLTSDKLVTCEVQNCTNGIVWELRKYKTAKKLSLADLTRWIIKICGLTCESETVQEDLNAKLEKFISLRDKFSRAPKNFPGEVERLMKWQFDFPESMGVVPPAPVFEPIARANLGPKLLKVLKEKGADNDDSVDISGPDEDGDDDSVDISDPDEDDDEQQKRRRAQEELVQLKRDLMAAKKIIVALNGRLSDLSKACSVVTDLSKTSISERRRIDVSLSKLSTEWNDILSTWHDCIQRLNDVNNNKGKYLNVGYMVRRNKTKQGVFDELNFEFERTVEEFRYGITSLIGKERQKKKPASREYKQKSRANRKRVSQDNSNESEEIKKQRLEEENQPKQTYNNMPVDEFLQSEQVENFMGGKFIPALKAIYIELTTMQFSCLDVHEIVFSVLSDLENLSVEKIPSQYFADNILMEAKMQVMLKSFTCLLKMNTAKVSNDLKTSFTLVNSSYSVTLPDETKILLGVREISQGSPETSLHFLKNALSEIVTEKSENLTLQQAIKVIKTFLTDQHLSEKKLIEIVFLYKQQLLSKLKSSLNIVSEVQRAKILSVNNFCASIYFFWGLSKLIDVTILAWELMSQSSSEPILPEGSCVLSKNIQQMYSLCQILDPLEENDLGKEFNEYLKQEKKLDANPLAPYKGNLFNMIFHNTAGLWFYYETGFANEYLEKMKEKEVEINSAFDCLKDEAQCLPVARALGLIGKLITIPVWNVVEDCDVNIDERYATLLKKFELWSKDASQFMKGEDQLFDDIPIAPDAVYVSLIKDNEATYASAKELLELVFTASVSYIKCFLFGGTLKGEPSAEVNSDLKTSIHKNFVIFDRITESTHSLSTYALDALMAYSKTRNGEWQDKLSNKNNKLFELIQKNVERQIKTLYKRKIKLNEILALTAEEKEEVGKCQLIEKRYKLIDEIVKWGGLWKNEKEVDERLKNMTEVDRLKALKAQILFRRHVLCETHEDRLLDLAVDGECFTYDTLRENLKSVLTNECQVNETAFELASATDNEDVKAKIFESCETAIEISDDVEIGKNYALKENFYWLLGKLIAHTFIKGGNMESLSGVCIARKKVDGVYFYFMRYKGTDAIFKFNEYKIAHDFKNQKLRVVDPYYRVMIRASLSRAFFKDDGDLEWHDCRVIKVVGPGPEFIVEFDFYGYNHPAADIPEIEVLTCTSRLLEDYRADRLRFL